MPHEADIVIIGAGVVGLAIAAEVSKNRRRVFVVEKNDSFGQETSSRNSQVIHSGIYYPYGSLKAQCCIEGKPLLYELCRKHGIEHRQLGKIIVATEPSEVSQLQALYEKGTKNGASDLRIISGAEAKKLEPNVKAIAALYAPSTGLLDVHAMMRLFLNQATENGVGVAYRSEVTVIDRNKGGYSVTVTDSSGKSKFTTRVLVNSAGLQSDRVAAMAGIDVLKAGYKIHYCKGEYFRVSRDKSRMVKGLIYPVPNVAGSGLGIHTTPTLDGAILVGPSTKYVDSIEYSVDEAWKPAFTESVGRFLPFIKADDLEPEMAGMRPTLQGPKDPVRDFVIRDESDKGLPGFINLIGIESPGLTSSPAIARRVGKLANNALAY
jgi:L-2-hydroxyglutarate oxidase LhgO